MRRTIMSLLLAIVLGACGSSASGDRVGDRVAARCGDGRVDVGEQCDGADLAGRSCASFKRDSQGALGCRADCTFDLAACHDPSCGNGRIDGLSGSSRELCEQCDGAALGGRSCAGFGGSGVLGCTDDCVVDRASCDELCANGRLEPGESCDIDPATGRAILPDGLTCESLGLGRGQLECFQTGGGVETPRGTLLIAQCNVYTFGCELGDGAHATCGDGFRTSAEECDATGLGGVTCEKLGFMGTLRCNSDCRFDFANCGVAPGPGQCGNGVVEQGEECDGAHFAPFPNDPAGINLLDCVSTALFFTGVELCAQCRIDRSRCPLVSEIRCGNGVAEDFEECDGADVRGLTCADLGGSGDLRCTPSCSLDRAGCSNVAGNGRREGDEVCDASGGVTVGTGTGTTTGTGTGTATVDLGGASCESLGYGTGMLACFLQQRSARTAPPRDLIDPTLLPRFTTFGCSRHGECGDGRATDGEECDRDDLGGASCATFDAEGELRCTDFCSLDLSGCRSMARCGDGRISFGEECEPGNLRVSCTADGGAGTYTCDPRFCFIDPTGCVFACSDTVTAAR
jgi:hypothetical protein